MHKINIFTFLRCTNVQTHFLSDFGLLGASLEPPKAVKIGWCELPRRVNNLPSAMLGRTHTLQTAPELILAAFEPPWGLHLAPFSLPWGVHTQLTQSPRPFNDRSETMTINSYQFLHLRSDFGSISAYLGPPKGAKNKR